MFSSKGKIDAFVEDSKDTRRISAAQLENQLRNFWEDLRRVLSDYQNSKHEKTACIEFKIIKVNLKKTLKINFNKFENKFMHS